MTVASDKLLYIISPERLHHLKKESKLINRFERVCFCWGDIVHKFIRGYSHLWFNQLLFGSKVLWAACNYIFWAKENAKEKSDRKTLSKLNNYSPFEVAFRILSMSNERKEEFDLGKPVMACHFHLLDKPP